MCQFENGQDGGSKDGQSEDKVKSFKKTTLGTKVVLLETYCVSCASCPVAVNSDRWFHLQAVWTQWSLQCVWTVYTS